jgi:hypothetical protein
MFAVNKKGWINKMESLDCGNQIVED